MPIEHHIAPTEDDRERLNAAIMERVNASGKVFLSYTKLERRYVIRLAIGNMRTERHHVAEAWELLQLAAGEVTATGALLNRRTSRSGHAPPSPP